VAYHLQVKRKDGSVIMAFMTSRQKTPKVKQRVECPRKHGRAVRGKVVVILRKAILADDGQPIDLVEAVEL
jgi:hypothetical protein